MSRETYLVVALREFREELEGAVAIISAVVLSVLIGVTALSVEYGQALLIRAETQRVADVASYSAAVAYTKDMGDLDSRRSAAVAAAQSISQLNGVDPQSILVEFEAGESGSDAFVHARIISEQPLFLARVIDPRRQVEISVRAVTQIGEESGRACIVALDSEGDGIFLSGSGKIVANECGVASNAVVEIPHCYAGAAILADTVFYDTLDLPGPPTICPEHFHNAEGGSSQRVKRQTDNYIEEDRKDTLEMVEGYFPLPAVPSIPSTVNLTVDYRSLKDIGEEAKSVGCYNTVLERVGSQDFVSFYCDTNVNIGELKINGGRYARFILHGNAREFNVQGTINHEGSQLYVGDGSTSLKEINVGGSVTSNGGSCVVFGRSDVVRVGGHFNLRGGAIFRGGRYLINNYFNASAGGNCFGRQGVVATNVTFIIRGMQPCPNSSSVLCISGGGNDFELTAPSEGVFRDFAIIGPLSADINHGISIDSIGSGGLIKGVVYSPQARFFLGGGGSASAPSDHCLQIIVAEMRIVGSGRVNAGNCPSFSGGGGGAELRLVQ